MTFTQECLDSNATKASLAATALATRGPRRRTGQKATAEFQIGVQPNFLLARTAIHPWLERAPDGAGRELRHRSEFLRTP
eukprot:7151399-Prymnesium_polylepis.1